MVWKKKRRGGGETLPISLPHYTYRFLRLVATISPNRSIVNYEIIAVYILPFFLTTLHLRLTRDSYSLSTIISVARFTFNGAGLSVAAVASNKQVDNEEIENARVERIVVEENKSQFNV